MKAIGLDGRERESIMTLEAPEGKFMVDEDLLKKMKARRKKMNINSNQCKNDTCA
ncbi:hypothetical protein MtrunA17_Chr3g0100451 [Medicago truncatula]|nr:hypothetical protein MtrunA17_Chr3g0100451 [Medicago truncatula]